MSSTDAIEESVRVKVRAALCKTLPQELALRLENKLASSFQTGAAYTSAYRTLVTMLKPKKDTLAPDANLVSSSSVPLKDSAGMPATGEFDHVASDLQSGKLRIGRVLVRLHEHLKEKRNLLKEVGPAAAAAAAAAAAGGNKAAGALDAETAKALRARGRGLLSQRIQSAKTRVGDGKTASVSDPLSWEEIADCSMQLFYQHQPHLQSLEQALKAYNRVESLSSEHLNKYPAFFLKRAAIHTITENFVAAIEDLQKFANKPGSVSLAAAPAAASAASTDTPASAGASASAAVSPSSVSFAALAAPRISAISSFVSTTSKLVASRFGKSDSEIATLLRGLPNPNQRDMRREILSLALLAPGDNDGRAIVGRVLGKLDQSSLWALQSNSSPAGAGAGAGVVVAPVPLPLPNLPYDSLASQFRTPASYVIVDSEGRAAVMSLFNLAFDPAQGKNKRLKPGDSIILLDPRVRDVALHVGDKSVGYRCVQMINPHTLFINLKPAFTGDDIVSTEE